MNTTTAAITAGVTIATIRTWCRIGAVAATKTAGRWDIDETSLRHRITLGKARARMTDQPKYQVTETTNRYGSPAWAVTRTDGTPAGYGTDKDSRIIDATYIRRETAEMFAKFYNGTPDGYRLSRDHYSARSMDAGRVYWKVEGGGKDDPSELRATWDEGTPVHAVWGEGATGIDMLIRRACQHAEGAAERIAKKAEADAIEAAEQAVRQARADQLAELERAKGPLATPRQVDYILRLLLKREHSGEGGGFFYGPKDRAGIEQLSRQEASTYIRSLTGDY